MTLKIKKVLVGGCFDVLHYGHLMFLQHACGTGNHLTVLVEPDERIRLFKNRDPVHSQAQRAALLSALNFVDKVIPIPLLHGFQDYLNVIQGIQPSIIAVTEGDPQLHNKQEQARLIGAEVQVVTSLLTGFSTTEIMQRLCS